MKKAAVIAACRSPISKIPGELNYIGEIELLAEVFKAVIKINKPLTIDEVIVGSSFPIERDNLSRKAILSVGLPPTISATTVNKTCASSDEALAIACHKIRCENEKTMLVGGIEKVSNSSYALHYMKKNIKKTIRNRMPTFNDIHRNILENDMTYICERLSRTHNITRQMQDEYTIDSMKKAIHANKQKHFRDEIVPITYKKDKQEHELYMDELLLSDRSQYDIISAPPMFLKDGVLTQYNAATMCDCAAAMLITEYDRALHMGLNPLVVVHAMETIGVTNDRMGHAMTKCVEGILEKSALKKSDIDLYEINESFAVQAMITIDSLGLDKSKVNVNGGNLALGYPIGATGLRMNITLIHEMLRRNSKYGLSVMSAGGNMAQAVIFENRR